eukprot:1922685-Amphidinium_carterae.1
MSVPKCIFSARLCVENYIVGVEMHVDTLTNLYIPGLGHCLANPMAASVTNFVTTLTPQNPPNPQKLETLK